MPGIEQALSKWQAPFPASYKLKTNPTIPLPSSPAALGSLVSGVKDELKGVYSSSLAHQLPVYEGSH